MDERELRAAFEDCSLPPRLFDHRQHVRLAWIYLCHYPLLEALDRFEASLRRYATSLGAATRFHRTITWAFMFLIHERMAQASSSSFDDFAAAHPDLLGPILNAYYRPETLDSERARETFVLQELSPLGTGTPREV